MNVPLEMARRTQIAPMVSPPRELRVNGQSALTDLANTGRTPTVSWEAPGHRPACHVTFVRKEMTGQDTWNIHAWASLRTQGTSVTLPPDLLVPDVPYRVWINADTSYDPKNPFLPSASGGWASAATALMKP